MPERSDCPHCEDGHEAPSRTAWGVRIDTATRDSDGQPTRLIVESTTGAHVAQADVDWLFGLIVNRNERRRCTEALREIERLQKCVADAEAALLELMPYRADTVTIPVDDVTYQWGCTTGSDLPITPTSEATARDLASRYGHGVVRRPVGPWEAAPAAEPTPELSTVDLLVHCRLAGVPVRSKITVPAGLPAPQIGSLLTLPCSWDSRHHHEYQVVPTPVSALQEYELVMRHEGEAPDA